MWNNWITLRVREGSQAQNLDRCTFNNNRGRQWTLANGGEGTSITCNNNDVAKDETVAAVNDDEHIIQAIVTSLLSSTRAKKSGKMTLTSRILVNDLVKVKTHFIKRSGRG